MNKYKLFNIFDKNIKSFFFTYGKKLLIIIPFIWLIFFFLFPFLIILKISFAKISRTIPPYTNLIKWHIKQISITLNLENYISIKDDIIYLQAYMQSLKIAVISTTICLFISYPLAWALSKSQKSIRSILLLLIILPSWTSFLIRVYSIIGLLDNNGILNKFLLWTGLIKQPLEIIYTDIAVYIGTVYCYLPFMALPIYNALISINYELIEAAYNLGAKPLKIFFKIILPLTKKGMFAGMLLVFVPTLGEYVIPELLGGPSNIMIGRIIWQEFFNNHDWPVASAISVVTLLTFIFPIIWFNKYQNKK